MKPFHSWSVPPWSRLIQRPGVRPFLLAVGVWSLATIGLTAAPAATAGQVPAPKALSWTDRIAADWLGDEICRADNAPPAKLKTSDDAAGGCDGVKNGQWGFHTAEAQEPWWQVDLREKQAIARVLIWNRSETASRAAKLALRLSNDAKTWLTVYQHNGTVFHGFTDQKPLEVRLTNETARYVRVQLPDKNFLHLDEVEVFGPADPKKNLALHCPADQVSLSQWSRDHGAPPKPAWAMRTKEVLQTCRRLADELRRAGVDVSAELEQLKRLETAAASKPTATVAESDDAPVVLPGDHAAARRLQRALMLKNPLLNFDAILFVKRVPPSFNHMSDQYYGWWSKPGGGIYLLRGFRGAQPVEECLSASFKEPGTFLRPTLSYDGGKVLFAWCRHYPNLAGEKDKLNKANVPEDAFFHLYEMNIDGSDVRRLTRGKYDDFDGRYLPDGRIVFLSTRRGQAIQVGRQSAQETVARPDQPDCYVRCGGGPDRPVAVYTLHTMNADGSDLNAISPFEMFEWTPEIGRDGSILYSRWDYIDRDNMPYMGLWAINPDGSNARAVYGNYTKAPHCTFEAKPVPGSHKIIFTASGHHSQTMGSLVLLDPSVGTEGGQPITRLTPEVPFPEIEAWPKTYYANPWPLSERHYLVAWGHEGATVPGPEGWQRWHAVQRPPNGMALYVFDAATGARELLFADAEVACGDPIPVRSRERPPMVASASADYGANEGRFLLADVYRGLKTVQRGEIKALRIVTVPPKTHPTMDFPNLGITHDDPGKCVLGTVPVAEDGSAYFRVPAGVIVFFQALNAQGVAVQTMKSATHVQPGQTLSCIGCHEHRQQAPPTKSALAAGREPARITVGPEGSWPVRFDKLVQPILDRQCVSCHRPGASDAKGAKVDLTAAKAYEALVGYGKPSLQDQVWQGYRQGFSTEGEGLAAKSVLLALLEKPDGHQGVRLDADSLERLVTWIDVYAQRLGAFNEDQVRRLEALRKASAALLIERKSGELKTARR